MKTKIRLSIALLLAFLLISCVGSIELSEAEGPIGALNDVKAQTTTSPMNGEVAIDVPKPTDQRLNSSFETERAAAQTPIPVFYQKFAFDFSDHFGDGLLITNWDDGGNTMPAREVGASDRYYPIVALQDGRISVEGHEGYAPPAIADITTTQWDDWGMQVFVYAGDLGRVPTCKKSQQALY